MHRLPFLGFNEQHQIETLDMFIPSNPFRRSIRPLTAPPQMLDQTASNEPINLPPSTTWVSVFEVFGPAFQVLVQAVHQLRQMRFQLLRQWL